MMLTDSVLVRSAQESDAPAIMAIVREHDLPLKWQWPRNAHGAVAEHEGEVVAFCCVSESIYGLVIDELWCHKNRDGVLGLGSLARWVEQIGQRLADERQEPIDVGGCCRLDNQSHLAALKHRGYVTVAEVLSKTFTPKGAV